MPLEDRNGARLNDEVGVSLVALVNDVLPSGEFGGDEGVCDGVLLVSGHEGEEGDLVDELPVFIVLLGHQVLDGDFEGASVKCPEPALAQGLDGGTPGGVVEESDFAEVVSFGEGSHRSLVNDDLHLPMLDHEVARSLER